MKLAWGRRVASLATVAALTAAGMGLASGSASATDAVFLNTSHSVGVYNSPNTWNGKVGGAPDFSPGSYVMAVCWTVGQGIDNLGDTWYQVYAELPSGSHDWQYWSGYIFAGYADGNAHSVNRDPYIPQCS
ncbi:hypothetical protein [Kitasatospora sp. NPDC087314]|uniref:hypothetical protein n=1 Tax=Kitasatospora sp. NPDC087314 TaxID=3364068 RepID=UPI0037F84C6F